MTTFLAISASVAVGCIFLGFVCFIIGSGNDDYDDAAKWFFLSALVVVSVTFVAAVLGAPDRSGECIAMERRDASTWKCVKWEGAHDKR